MTYTWDIESLKRFIDAMLSQQTGPVTRDDVDWILFVLSHRCSNFTPKECEQIIIRAALERGDRPLLGFPLDS